MKRLFQIHPADTVAVALEGISAGEEGILSNGERFTVQEDIPAGHKAALWDIALGEEIRKYGQVIGAACRSIGKGEWVHTHNLASVMQSDGEYTYTPGPCPLPPQAPAFFQGYRRPNGKVGVPMRSGFFPQWDASTGWCPPLRRRAVGLWLERKAL